MCVCVCLSSLSLSLSLSLSVTLCAYMQHTMCIYVYMCSHKNISTPNISTAGSFTVSTDNCWWLILPELQRLRHSNESRSARCRGLAGIPSVRVHVVQISLRLNQRVGFEGHVPSLARVPSSFQNEWVRAPANQCFMHFHALGHLLGRLARSSAVHAWLQAYRG